VVLEAPEGSDISHSLRQLSTYLGIENLPTKIMHRNRQIQDIFPCADPVPVEVLDIDHQDPLYPLREYILGFLRRNSAHVPFHGQRQILKDFIALLRETRYDDEVEEDSIFF
jgi:hypothetical protein